MIEYYSLRQFEIDTKGLANKIRPELKKYTSIYGVPRGGIPLMLSLSKELDLPLSENPFDNGGGQEDLSCLIVDDLIDSGNTRLKYPNHDYAVIHCNKNNLSFPTYYVKEKLPTVWIEYWWERNESPAEDSILRLIQIIGEDPKREGLKETPKRVLNSYKFLFSGYNKSTKEILKTFTNESCDQIVLLKDIELYSMCEHHMLPFWGKAHIAYIPNDKIVGISKLARLLEVYSRRLQIQERIGEQVTNDLMKYINPVGAACIIEATHLCMRMRGVEKQNSIMITSSLKGVFMEGSNKGLAARNELMRLVK